MKNKISICLRTIGIISTTFLMLGMIFAVSNIVQPVNAQNQWINYYGSSKIYCNRGWNIVEPFCTPYYLDFIYHSPQQITAEWWCDNYMDIDNTKHNDWIRYIKQIFPDGTSYLYDGLNNTGINFYIWVGISYWVYPRYEGYLINPGADYSTPTSQNSWTYDSWSQRLYADNEYGKTGQNYVEPINDFRVRSSGGGGNGTSIPYRIMVSSYAQCISNLQGEFYTGIIGISVWNNTDVYNQHWQTYDSRYPTTDFVHYSNAAYGNVGSISWGLVFYLPEGGAYWTHLENL